MNREIESFLSYIEVEQRCSPHTLDAYGRDIRQFVDWLCDGRRFEPTSVTLQDIRAWLSSLASQGLAPASLRRKTQSLRAFYKWGIIHGIFSSNPAKGVILAKKRKQLPNFVKENEMEEILKPTAATFEEYRTYIVLTILYSLGLRQAELLALTDRDISFSSREIKVTGKRNKQRVIPIPAQLADEILRWQELRDARYPDLEMPRPLIAGPHGPISKTTLYLIVRDGLAGASTGRKSPHTLRHSFATAMINNGADLDAVRELLGHASLATTQIYTHLSFREMLDSYRTSHPRAKKQ